MSDATPPDGCACEGRVDTRILEGYACGKPTCWRTAAAQASFDAFVVELAAERDAAAGSRGTPPG